MIFLYCFLIIIGIYISTGPIILTLYVFVYRRGVHDFIDNIIWITYKLKDDIPPMTARKPVWRYIQQCRRVAGDWRIFLAFMLACTLKPSVIFSVISHDLYLRNENNGKI
jgi:hypothetical protein